MIQIVATLFRGFCMGAADIVPGVSGGTIALVFGIYERFLGNIRNGARFLAAVIKLDFKKAKDLFIGLEWLFLIPLGVGLLAAVATLSGLLEGLLESNPEELAGFFFGLVVGSILVAWGLLKAGTNPTTVGVAVGVGIVAFFLLGFQSGPVSDPALWAFFFTGAFAICAMILPGISGSFIMLMMGMYAAVLGAIHDLEIAPLAIFMVGAVVGLALFSNVLGYLLDNYHDIVIASLVGLMLGSFRVLWPWPNGVGVISEESSESVSGTELGAPTGDWWVPVGLAVLGFVVVVGITKFAGVKDSESHAAVGQTQPS